MQQAKEESSFLPEANPEPPKEKKKIFKKVRFYDDLSDPDVQLSIGDSDPDEEAFPKIRSKILGKKRRSEQEARESSDEEVSQAVAPKRLRSRTSRSEQQIVEDIQSAQEQSELQHEVLYNSKPLKKVLKTPKPAKAPKNKEKASKKRELKKKEPKPVKEVAEKSQSPKKEILKKESPKKMQKKGGE